MFSVPITVFAVVGVINAVNMMDGMDGLAGSMGFVAFAWFGVVAALLDNQMLASFAWLLCGALAGFLLHNLRLPWQPQARVFLDAAHAKGKESDERSLNLAAYLDLSFKPRLISKLRAEDWQRSRSFWARIGYDRIFDVTEESGREVAENRGIVAVHGKAPLPADVWLEARARVDLRWIGDEYSTRYRARLEAQREFKVRGYTVAPYVNYEWFYDTRYDAWARTLATLGAEVKLSEHFRLEMYVANQEDEHPQEDSLGALGLVAKWYY